MATEVMPEKTVDLSSVLQLGRIEKTKEVFKGLSITLQTLSASHQQKILAALPTDNQDALGRYATLQIETLASATVAMNGVKADYASWKSMYSEMQSRVLQEVYSFYVELVEEQNSVMDSLKKT
jgi:hypothetical protein